MKEKLLWVDSLKGLAIMGVVFIHSGATLISCRIGDASARGVQLFYVISGFLAFLSISNIKLHSKKEIIKWWVRRIFKLAPLYYFAIIVYVLLTIITPSNALIELNNFTIRGGISIVTFLNVFSPHYAGIAVMMSYIPNLVFLYLLTPYLYKRITNMHTAILATIMIYFLTTIIIFAFRIVLNEYGAYTEDWRLYLYNRSFLAQLPVCLIGIILYFYYKTYYSGGGAYRTVLVISIYWIFSLVLWPAGNIGQEPIWINMYILYAIGFGGVIISQMYCPCRLLVNRYWSILGKHSYNIFLFHMIFLQYININNFLKFNNVFLMVILRFSITLLASLLLSIGINFLVGGIFDNFSQLIIKKIDILG